MEVTANESTSASTSKSYSLSDSIEMERVQGEEKPLPETPMEAVKHPDIWVFQAITGRLPGTKQYKSIINTLTYIRESKELTYETVITYLKPYWLAWSSRKRLDGRPYDPSSLTWLVEWGLNGNIPPQGITSISNQNQADIIKQIAARTK